MIRPRLTPAVVRGLRTIASLACADMEAGALNEAGRRKRADAQRALKFLYKLCDWYEHQAGRLAAAILNHGARGDRP